MYENEVDPRASGGSGKGIVEIMRLVNLESATQRGLFGSQSE